MLLARERRANAKVVDRRLIIGHETFHIDNIPEQFKPPPMESSVDKALHD